MCADTMEYSFDEERSVLVKRTGISNSHGSRIYRLSAPSSSTFNHQLPSGVAVEFALGMTENPYLARLSNSQGSSEAHSKGGSLGPLYGFVPRQVTGQQVRAALVGVSFLIYEIPLLHACLLSSDMIQIPSRNKLTRHNTKRFFGLARSYLFMRRSTSS